MSDTVLTIVHQKDSVSGHIGALLEERGYRLQRCCPCAGDALPQAVEDYAAIVIFGGPMSVNDCSLEGIRKELAFIPSVLDAGVPFFGLCLGGQMLSRVLGGTVTPHPERFFEIGYTRVYPTEAGQDWFRDTDIFYQWHGEGFDVPQSATLIATGDIYPNQAFTYGKNAIATQFHPEITRAMIDRWTMSAAHRLVYPGAQPRRAHVRGWEMFSPAVDRWCRSLFDRFELYGPAGLPKAAGETACEAAD